MGVPTVMVPEPLLSKAFLFVQIIVSIIHSIRTFFNYTTTKIECVSFMFK